MSLVAFFIAGGIAGVVCAAFLRLCADRATAIRRVGWRRALARPSHCDHCRRPLRRGDTLPILSWLLLNGRARCCGAALSLSGLAVEGLGFCVGGTALLALFLLL